MRGLAARRCVQIAALVAIFCSLPPLQRAINERRVREDIAVTQDLLANLPVQEFFTTVLIGGFRALAVDLIWIRAQSLQEEREWFEIMALYDLIMHLQPHFEEVWIFAAWNMICNISRECESLELKSQWIHQGLELLERGVEKNKRSYKIPWTLGSFYLRCALFPDEATQHARRLIEEQKGKSVYALAIERFEEAASFEECRRRPLWYAEGAFALDQYAKEAVRKGDLAKMRALRKRAIDWWRGLGIEIRGHDPIGRLEALLSAYDAEEALETALVSATELIAQEKGAEAVTQLRTAGKRLAEAQRVWSGAYFRVPYDPEFLVGLTRAGAQYVGLAERYRRLGRLPDAEAALDGVRRVWEELLSAAAFSGQLLARVRELSSACEALIQRCQAAGDDRLREACRTLVVEMWQKGRERNPAFVLPAERLRSAGIDSAPASPTE